MVLKLSLIEMMVVPDNYNPQEARPLLDNWTQEQGVLNYPLGVALKSLASGPLVWEAVRCLL